MGMSSQAGLCMLLNWKSNNARQQQSLSLQKMALTRDMTRVSREYQEALNTKCLKWSNNAGSSYTDLSYSTLMYPGNANANKPYLITNVNDQVVLDAKYEKYAKMISPDGAPGGDWESNRTKILSELTGVSEEKINNASATTAAVNAAADKVNALKLEGDLLEEPIDSDTADQFFSKAGSVNVNNVSYDIGKLYSSNSWEKLGGASTAEAALTNLLNGVAENMKNYLSDTDYENFKTACKTYMDDCGHYFGGATESDKQGLESGISGIKKDGDNYSVNIKTILDTVLGSYKALSDSNSYGQNSMGTEVFYTRDKNSSAWQSWKTKHDDWQKRYDAALEEYNSAVNTDNMSMTAEEESSIKFYDLLFSAIAEKGWVVDSQVDDNQYLNNMFQNNQFFITTMSEQVDDKENVYYEYNTNLASNTDNIFAVNDSTFQNEALVKYEREKATINEKESRIDMRMTNLETQLSAINNMIKGHETVIKDNTERTMNIFT